MIVKINGYLKHQNNKKIINTKGILEDKKIVYHFNGEKHIINIEELLLTRENDEYKHIMHFNGNCDSCYTLKNYNLDTIIKINTISKVIKKNNLFIKYEVEETKEKYEYEIEWSLVQ